MAESIKKPAIRFAGFTDDWEQRKAQEVCSISTGKSNTQDHIEDGVYPFYVRSPIIERSNRYLFDEEAVLTVGDGVGTGKVYHYVNGKYDLHQRVYRLFDFRNGIKGKYFYYFFSSHFYDRVMAMTAKTSVDSVRYEMIADMDICYPTEAEQEMITGIFSSLDNLITLHQRKCDTLANVKKSMLGKMFPKEGEKVPEIRFKGFTDDWEQRKLRASCSEFKSGDFIKADNIKEEGPYPVFGGNGLRGYTDKYNHNGDYALIGRQGALCGNMNYSFGKAYFTEHAVTVKANAFNETLFLFYCLGIMNLGQYSGQSAQPGLAVGNLIDLETMLPQKGEQKRIGTFFQSLDNLITLHQRELEKLKNIKKSCLENMFV